VSRFAGKRHGDIGYWGVGGRRLVALLLGATIDVHRSAAFASMALGACDEFS
jgi:hypothetical protein